MLMLGRPNPLLYPAGYAPGINTAHRAYKASSSFRSVVSSPVGSLVALNTGRQQDFGAVTAAGSGIHGVIGPVTKFGSGDKLSFDNPTSSNPATTTFLAAGIFYQNSGGALSFLASDAANNTGWGFSVGDGHLYNGAGFDTFIATSSNVPYFEAVSLDGSTLNLVQKNLNNGQILSASISIAGATETGLSVTSFGGINGFNFNGGIAASVVGTSYLTLPQLLAWADDPWSFWYPDAAQDADDSFYWAAAAGAAGRTPYNPWPQAAPIMAM